jgi:hypothetical protein
MLKAYEQIAKENPNDIPMQLRQVEAHKKLAKVDKPKLSAHLEAAAAILENLTARNKLDEAQRRLVEYSKTQLSNGRIDLYNLIGRRSRLARK